eukprot:GHVU01099575.1.p1 GENE.GHVU01099575.1~~GHVU01099575.1.p1  ORF type:complete len:155 (+),score=13.81 GHVU01099575.1:3-467(+)
MSRETDAATARMMAAQVLRDDAGTPEERALRMVEAAVLMGQAASKAAQRGDRIRNYENVGDYRGQVRDGVPDGLGVLRFEDGSVQGLGSHAGEWSSGIRHGLCVFRRPDGRIGYAGQFHVGQRRGLGVSWNEDGSVEHAGWWNRHRASQTAPPQ